MICLALLILVLNIAQTKYFVVDSIEIQGYSFLVNKDLLDALQKMKNKHIIYIDTSKIESQMLEDIRIKNLKITKVYPNKIRVKIEERQPEALILHNSKLYVSDINFNIFAKNNEFRNKKLPLVTYTNENKVIISSVLKELIKTKMYDMVSEIFEDEENRIIFALDNGIRVICNDKINADKINEGLKVLQREKNNNLEYIDLRFKFINVK